MIRVKTDLLMYKTLRFIMRLHLYFPKLGDEELLVITDRNLNYTTRNSYSYNNKFLNRNEGNVV